MAVVPDLSGTAVTSYSHPSRSTSLAAEEPSDADLVAAFNAGHARAFSEIVRRHRARLTYVARRYAKNDHDVQDIVQEALFRAARNLHSFRNESSLSTWLHRLVINAGHDHMVRRQRSTYVSLDDENKVNQDVNPLLAHDPTTHVERALVLREVVSRLPAAQRRALLLIDVAGLTIERAAQEMGVQPGTVKSRRARARKAIHQQLTAPE
ncbi:sigma-70 family RNA polymerase sigma factor [Corynebacterium cystitidis]|uniref:sigma-70 family RNA polymerase sigma factor n=1 Tax=Corynebacterium cystitidis TaxID=35757 RepID=UPI00211EC784|nr:sigma-70 family RNA polymerase sigma factor [Corynebacterium cystitidis]